MRLPLVDLAARVQPLLAEAGLWRDVVRVRRARWFLRVLELLQPRAKKLGQFADDGRPFFADAMTYDDTAVQKHLRVAGMRAHLLALESRFAEAQPFDQQSSELLLRSVAENAEAQARSLIHATRVAVTGRSVSPGLYEVLELMGRDASARESTRASSPSE